MKEIKTETRTIKAEWSTELIKDLNSFHSIDVETELEKILAGELKVQIRRENRRKKIKNLTKHT
jgi:hypothetical protein